VIRLLVCGGRDFLDWQFLELRMRQTDDRHRIAVVIHGAAKGADRMAGTWADLNGRQQLAFPADWDELGRRAGGVRNGVMLREGKPDLVLAFPGGVGTNDMIRKAVAMGVPVWHTGLPQNGG
jgi:hypothetical protein